MGRQDVSSLREDTYSFLVEIPVLSKINFGDFSIFLEKRLP